MDNSKTKSSKINLDSQMLFSSLEDSLSRLSESIIGVYEGDATKIKTVSGILRDLVCYSSGNRGLFWKVKDNHIYDDVIDVPDYQTNFANAPNVEKGMFFAVLMEHGIWQLNGPKLERRSLQDYLQNGVSVRLKLQNSEKPIFLKPVDVIKEAADQIGVHTDQGVSETFATLVSLKSGRTSVLFRLIMSLAILVAEIKKRIIETARTTGYKPRRPIIDLPEKSLGHLKVDYDLVVPELDMPEVRHFEFLVNYRSAKEALNGPLPFTIGRIGKKNLMVENWVGLPLSINFDIYTNNIYQGTASFQYPAGMDSSKTAAVAWNDQIIQLGFGDSILHLPVKKS